MGGKKQSDKFGRASLKTQSPPICMKKPIYQSEVLGFLLLPSVFGFAGFPFFTGPFPGVFQYGEFSFLFDSMYCIKFPVLDMFENCMAANWMYLGLLFAPHFAFECMDASLLTEYRRIDSFETYSYSKFFVVFLFFFFFFFFFSRSSLFWRKIGWLRLFIYYYFFFCQRFFGGGYSRKLPKDHI